LRHERAGPAVVARGGGGERAPRAQAFSRQSGTLMGIR
jgi:hypothetical protein